jgi:acylphosphatase
VNRIKIRTHVYVSGKVQGVFFRARIVELAVRSCVTGWVRNLPDGRVEAVFEGEDDVVKTLVDFCRRGPRRALVENIGIIEEPFKGELAGFSIRR